MDYEDPLMPEYRKIWAEIQLTAEFPFGHVQSFPVVLSDDQRDLSDLLNHHRVVEPIARGILGTKLKNQIQAQH